VPWQAAGPRGQDGLRLYVRLTPRAARDGIAGIKPTADGHGGAGNPCGCELDVKVTAAPEKGRANAALIALLAKALGLPQAAFALAAGETDRRKQITIAGDGPALATVLAALIAGSAPRKA
jgi:uncharacterized protein YggU (UPF0235/DUF167 family)